MMIIMIKKDNHTNNGYIDTFKKDCAYLLQLVSERGERLNELDDSSARMMNQAENFAQAAHQIMLKYKDKKWYQF